MDDNSSPHIHGFLIPQLIWLKTGIGGKKEKPKKGGTEVLPSGFSLGLRKLQFSPSWTWDRASAERDPVPEEEHHPEGGKARVREFLIFLSFFFFFLLTGRGGAVGFTRRNDASQPRLHPAPPQRNRLFGKKRTGVGKSHSAVFTLHAPNYLWLSVSNTLYLRHEVRQGGLHPVCTKNFQTRECKSAAIVWRNVWRRLLVVDAMLVKMINHQTCTKMQR